MENVHIKYTKRANQYCVTYFVKSQDGKTKTQHQAWYSTEEEARKFMEEKHD